MNFGRSIDATKVEASKRAEAIFKRMQRWTILLTEAEADQFWDDVRWLLDQGAATQNSRVIDASE